jgi:acetyl-CoA C-acetyltransferase
MASMKRGSSAIVGAAESDIGSVAADMSVIDLMAQGTVRALADAGLTLADVDGLFCATTQARTSAMSFAEYLQKPDAYVDSTIVGGSSFEIHVAHAQAAIEAGLCSVAVVAYGSTQRSAGRKNASPREFNPYETPFKPFMPSTAYAMAANRHMHEYGTTSEQLAWIKVAASHHAQHNPHAMLPKVVTVEDVVNSPMVSDPLHRLDCCVISDGGGALIVTRPEIAKSLKRSLVKVKGHGEATKNQNAGYTDLTYSGAVWSGPRAFEEAGVTPKDIQYASIYDSFTITVLIQLEDLGFCKKGEGGKFVADGNLISGVGKLPFNTDGGGLCNNHPANRGGMTKVIEAVRQLRHEAHPKVQVPGCTLALAHGTGGLLGTRHGSATVILERE